MTADPPEQPRTAALLGWAVDVVVGSMAGVFVGFLVMIAVERLGGGLWSLLPPLGVLAGLAVMRWDRDRVPDPGEHRRVILLVAAILAVASVAFFGVLAYAISRFE